MFAAHFCYFSAAFNFFENLNDLAFSEPRFPHRFCLLDGCTLTKISTFGWRYYTGDLQYGDEIKKPFRHNLFPFSVIEILAVIAKIHEGW